MQVQLDRHPPLHTNLPADTGRHYLGTEQEAPVEGQIPPGNKHLRVLCNPEEAEPCGLPAAGRSCGGQK